jgi:hypothetical protein
MTDGRRIAGHLFIESVFGPVCSIGECVRLWVEIEDVTESDVGKRDIAHAGELNGSEYSEIKEERQRRATLKEELCARAWEATMAIGKE